MRDQQQNQTAHIVLWRPLAPGAESPEHVRQLARFGLLRVSRFGSASPMADQNKNACKEEQKWVDVRDLIKESGLSLEQVCTGLERLFERGEIKMRVEAGD